MSISSAFSGALSGLQAFGKASEIIAANIANATTPGYGKRAVVLASSTVAPGVGVAGISRLADPVVLAARRTAARVPATAASALMAAPSEKTAGSAS